MEKTQKGQRQGVVAGRHPERSGERCRWISCFLIEGIQKGKLPLLSKTKFF